MTVESTLRRTGYGAQEAAGQLSDGRFFIRPAVSGDIPSLEQVERDAFPEQWPPTRFASEIRKQDALYLVATSPAASPASGPAETGEPVTAAHSKPGLPSALKGVLHIRVPRWRRTRVNPEQMPGYTAGFVGMWFVVDEVHVIAIGVRKFERRRGVGELLLLGAFDAARRRRMNVMTLEVRKSNSGAQALYSKYGFREVGLRKRYYVDNGEDAIIMTTPPISTPESAERVQRLAREHAERWGRPELQPPPR